MRKLRSLGANIRYHMRKNDIKIQEMADEMGIDYFDLCCILEGYLFMSFDEIKKVARILNIEVKDMLSCPSNIYNEYVFNNKMDSEEEIAKADAILDRIECLIHDIRCKELDEFNALKTRVLNLERKLKEYESNAIKS